VSSQIRQQEALLVTHRNSRLTVFGRHLIVQRLQQGYTQAATAAAAGVSRSTVAKWAKRYRDEDISGLQDRSSRARTCRHALPEHIIEAIVRLRRQLGCGPHRIAWELGLAASTVYGVLRRAGLSVLARLDRTTRAVQRYERERPGELVHFDVKKLGKIPDGGGKRFFDQGWVDTGAGLSAAGRSRSKAGYDYLHVAVDDHSRYAYVEALPDEKGPTAAAFLMRSVLAFAAVGVNVERVLSDNGGCYRSHVFRRAATDLGVGLRYIRPRRPQTNGKAERFIKTLQAEWAYLQPYTTNQARLEDLTAFLQRYNHQRPHTAIGNRPPASRL
jgi:transposase InsO family protein